MANIKRGLCVSCYKLWRRSPADVPQILPDRRVKGTTRERFLSKVVAGPQGCAIWTGTIGRGGYGQFALRRGKPVSAHRFAYELLIGPIPDGLTLDHTCHNQDATCPHDATCLHRRCVNPNHLEPVTRRENILRSPHTMPSRLIAGTAAIWKGGPQ